MIHLHIINSNRLTHILNVHFFGNKKSYLEKSRANKTPMKQTFVNFLFFLHYCSLLPILSLNQQKSPLYCHPQSRIITGKKFPAVKADFANCHHPLSPMFFPLFLVLPSLGKQSSFLPNYWDTCIPHIYGYQHSTIMP